MNKAVITILAASLACGSFGVGAASRDYISIVGSSTVYPFATVVAEWFGKTTSFKTPKVESTGSGGGLKLFCSGVGVAHPDVTNASRRIKQSEIDLCARNGVSQIVELKVGYDGIAVAQSRKAESLTLTRKDLFLALASEVPDPSGDAKLVPNPYRRWNEVNPDLPSVQIEVLGPPPTSGTRDAFVELALEGGCQAFQWIEALKQSDPDRFKSVCHRIREDGTYVEAGENDNLIVQKLLANPDAVGIFGFSFLEQNEDKVQGATIDGVAPEFELIADGQYPISRPLYIYVKKAHVGVIPGLSEFAREFLSDKASGEDGYLSDRGLIPMPESEHQAFQRAANEMTPLPAEI